MSSFSDDLDSTHFPAQDWSYHIPSQPHIIVPLHGTVQDFRIHLDPLINSESSGFTNTDFLKAIRFSDVEISNPVFSWKYESRRTAQAVLPFLYLGPVTVANDVEFLQTNGITMVLAVRNTKSAQANLLRSKVAAKLGIESHTIDVAGNQELIAAFPEGIEMINAHLSAMYHHRQRQNTAEQYPTNDLSAAIIPGKVLIYCETGNDRSASLVAAYIMAMFSMNLVKAIQTVQVHRFAAVYDDYSRTILQTYESILKAKRDVIKANMNSKTQCFHGRAGSGSKQDSSIRSTSKISKRNLAEADDDEDIDMADDGQDILEGSARRGGRAPFDEGPGIPRPAENGF